MLSILVAEDCKIFQVEDTPEMRQLIADHVQEIGNNSLDAVATNRLEQLYENATAEKHVFYGVHEGPLAVVTFEW